MRQRPVVDSNHSIRALLPAWGRSEWGISVQTFEEVSLWLLKTAIQDSGQLDPKEGIHDNGDDAREGGL